MDKDNNYYVNQIREELTKLMNNLTDTDFYPNEEWRSVVGYEDMYEVSDYGRVKSLDRYITVPANKRNKESIQFKKGDIRKLQVDRYGYARVLLRKEGSKPKFTQVHRLVAEAFIPNPENKPCVNHLDENPLNNDVNNLEWSTVSENNAYGNRNKKTSKSRLDFSTNVGRKPVDCFDMDGNYICTYPSIEYANKCVRPNSKTSHIGEVCKGVAKSYAGYKWAYATEEHVKEIQDKIDSGELVNYHEDESFTNKLSCRQNTYLSNGIVTNVNSTI